MSGMRAGTVNVAFMVAMGLAMNLAIESLDYENNEVRRLRDKLEDSFLSLPDVDIIGPQRVTHTQYHSGQL
jgi:cysteine desulfurase